MGSLIDFPVRPRNDVALESPGRLIPFPQPWLDRLVQQETRRDRIAYALKNLEPGSLLRRCFESVVVDGASVLEVAERFSILPQEVEFYCFRASRYIAHVIDNGEEAG